MRLRYDDYYNCSVPPQFGCGTSHLLQLRPRPYRVTMADRSPSYDPGASEIEERAAIFDPDWLDADEDDDEDDMDYEPAREDLSGSEREAFEDAEENILNALLEEGDVEIEIADDDGEDDDENEDEEEEEEEEAQASGRTRPVFGTYL